jgi:carbamoyltransferase
VNGKLIAACEEERFRRIKHWAGFPTKSIEFCLSEAGVSIDQVDHIAISRDPKAHFFKKILFVISHRLNLSYLRDRIQNRKHVKNIKDILAEELGVERSRIKANIHHVEHHRSHMASAFFVSGFDESAVVSIDALGDYVSTMWGVGREKNLDVLQQVQFPHSLGFLYTAGTQYLGFPKYGDEYKVMGLAAYGKPEYLDAFRKMIRLKDDGKFELNLDYFRHHRDGISMTWENGEPTIGYLFSDQWGKLLGLARKPTEEITHKHENIAASLQAIFEEVYFEILNRAYDFAKSRKLCLAGGCAMNSVANGKIFDRTPFEDVYVQAAAGDAGTAIGAAFYAYHHVLGNPRQFVMQHAYWGPQFEKFELNGQISQQDFQRIENEDELCRLTAQAIASGKVVGWFQGRMEWGARALGNRSILADPRNPEMRDILNARIKRRETFRPFAPSILEEAVGDYFEKKYPDPFMIKVYPVKKEKRKLIPAVTHVDGTGRLQTVNRQENLRYWKLIKAFETLTGIPIVLNTSFNENEPIVCSPKEAIDCFQRTKMDVLVLGDYFLEKKKS